MASYGCVQDVHVQGVLLTCCTTHRLGSTILPLIAVQMSAILKFASSRTRCTLLGSATWHSPNDRLESSNDFVTLVYFSFLLALCFQSVPCRRLMACCSTWAGAAVGFAWFARSGCRGSLTWCDTSSSNTCPAVNCRALSVRPS